jgi:hypothetical protein
MKEAGEGSLPSFTRWVQNWREVSNCSLMLKALEGSTEPSALAGV